MKGIYNGKREGKTIGARIADPKIWDQFIGFVEEKHGETYGFVEIELQNALKYLIDKTTGASNINDKLNNELNG